jgi:3-deoxy-manno-octulosonate cytidylyltransferase (CMP-KDO synthetase)
MKVLLIIPARYQSTRFPGKPLIDILGKTMIERVYEKCTEAFPSENIYVATEDTRIIDFCTSVSIKSVLTSDNCFTGTDRVAETAEILEADVYINVQGDEPLFNPEDIKLLLEKVKENPNQVYCGYCPIDDEEMYKSRSTPKVVVGLKEQLLYMSRSPIPGNKSGAFGFSYRQVCAYAFPKDALRIFKAVGKKTPLELEEDLELLRFLEMGYPVQMIQMSKESIAVDHPVDLEKVIQKIVYDNPFSF